MRSGTDSSAHGICYNSILSANQYCVVVVSEVINLITCTPVEVKIRKIERRFPELAVETNDLELFMSFRTRILQKHGTEIDCNVLFPLIF